MTHVGELYWDGEISFIDKTPTEVEQIMSQHFEGLWDMPPFSFSIVAATFSHSDTAISVHAGDDQGLLAPYMDAVACGAWLGLLEEYAGAGYKLWGMNTTLFDWKLLALRSGEWERCTRLSLQGYDPTFQMWCQYGFPIGLNPCAKAAGLPVKEMPGAGAPLAWARGEYDAVTEYVCGDCTRLKGVVASIKENRGPQWISRKGGLCYRPFDKGMATAEQCVRYYLGRDVPVTEPGTWWADELGLRFKK
jgi:hypothetical protein